MDIEIRPKPQRPRVKWDPVLRLWRFEPYAEVYNGNANLYRYVSTFTLRINIANRRYSHA